MDRELRARGIFRGRTGAAGGVTQPRSTLKLVKPNGQILFPGLGYQAPNLRWDQLAINRMKKGPKSTKAVDQVATFLAIMTDSKNLGGVQRYEGITNNLRLDGLENGPLFQAELTEKGRDFSSGAPHTWEKHVDLPGTDNFESSVAYKRAELKPGQPFSSFKNSKKANELTAKNVKDNKDAVTAYLRAVKAVLPRAYEKHNEEIEEMAKVEKVYDAWQVDRKKILAEPGLTAAEKADRLKEHAKQEPKPGKKREDIQLLLPVDKLQEEFQKTVDSNKKLKEAYKKGQISLDMNTGQLKITCKTKQPPEEVGFFGIWRTPASGIENLVEPRQPRSYFGALFGQGQQKFYVDTYIDFMAIDKSTVATQIRNQVQIFLSIN